MHWSINTAIHSGPIDEKVQKFNKQYQYQCDEKKAVSLYHLSTQLLSC